MGILLLLFIIVPIAEISLLMNVGGAIGGFNTVLFVIFTAFLGAYLVKQQGFSTLQKLQQESNAGRIPALQIAEGAALLVAGAVLLTPGFITDAIGFALLIPFTRRAIISVLAARYANKNGAGFSYTQNGTQNPHQSSSGKTNDSTIIEGEYTDSDAPK